MRTFLLLILGMFMLSACSQEKLTVRFLESNKSYLPFIVITTPAQTVSAGACSNAVSFELRDSTGAVKLVDVATKFFLTPSSLGFYLDSGCTVSVTDVEMATGSSTATFYYKSSTVGMYNFSISNPTVTGSFQLANITAANISGLGFSPAGIHTFPNVCSTTPIQIHGVDAFNNYALPTQDIPIVLTGLNVYDDPSCSTQISSLTLTTASPTKTIYVLGSSTIGTYNLLAQAGGGFTDGILINYNYNPLSLTVTDNRMYLGETQYASISGGTPTYVFTTNGGTIAQNGLYTANQVGDYTVTVTDGVGRTATLPLMVRSQPSWVPANVTIKAGQSYTLNPTGGFTPYTTALSSGSGGYAPATYTFTAPTFPTISQISLTDNKGTSTITNITTVAGDPSGLYFVTTAQSVTTAQCSNAVEAGLVDMYGNATVANNNYTITPAGSGMTFYSDSICSMPISSLQILNGASTASFFFKTQQPGMNSLFITSPTLSMASQTVSATAATLSQLKFTPDTLSMLAGECKQTILSTVDVYGNTGAPTAAMSVGMTNSGDLTFFSDASCTTALIPPFTLDSSTPTLTVYVRSTIASTSTNYATSSGLANATLATHVSPDVPSKLIFSQTPASIATRMVYFSIQPQVKVSDQYNNIISTAANTITLSASPDPTCSNVAGGVLWTASNPVNAVSGVAQFSNVKYDTVQNIYLRAQASGLLQACSTKISVQPDYAASLVAGPDTIPSDNLAYSKLLLIPRIEGNKVGEAATIEIETSSLTVSMMCGSGACSPCISSAYNCVKAEDIGRGAYSITMKDSATEIVNFAIYHVNNGNRYKMGDHSVLFDTQSFTTLSANTTVTSSYAGQNLYMTGGNITFDASTSGKTFGHLFIRGATVKHLPTTTSAVNELNVSVASLNLLSGSIDASGLGYLYGSGTSYSWGANAPSTALGSTGTGSTGAGGSHAGRGAIYSSYTSGVTYGNYRDPKYPGGAGSVSSSAGGGVVRIHSTSPCVIANGATIKADGKENGAGGSIMLTCEAFLGDASLGAITSNGGTPTSTSNTGGGGGGRTALVTTSELASFTESFRYPTNLTEMTNFNNNVQSRGGGATGLCGGAGTVYLYHGGHTYGSLIVDNAGLVCKPTELVSLSKTTSTPTGQELPFTPAATSGSASLYKGLRLRPDVSANNGTANPLDDNIVTIDDNTLNSLTVTGDLSTVIAGKTMRSIDILDQLYIGGSAMISTSSDIAVMNGNFFGTTLDYTNGVISQNDGGTTYPLIENVNITAGTYSPTYMSAKNISLNGGNITSTTTINAENITVNSGILSVSSINLTKDLNVNAGTVAVTNLTAEDFFLSGGTANVQYVSLTNDFDGTGGILTHPATTTTTIYRINMFVGGKFVLQGTNVELTSKGYPIGYSYGGTAPSTSLASTGASHGGQSGNGGFTYGNYKFPELPGAGGAGGAGGGVIKVSAGGLCQIDAPSVINAKGADATLSSGAGGSINLKCAGFKGSASSAALNASGGTSTLLNYGGGGGRISLVSTGTAATFQESFALPSDNTTLTSLTNVVQARGGTATTYPGAAGTIFLKHAGQSYGGLIVNNNSVLSSGKTLLPYMHQTTTAAVTAGSTQFYFTISPVQQNLFKGLVVRPNVTATNGTSTLLDDFRTEILENTTTYAITADAIPAQASGTEFRTIEVLNNLYIMSGAEVTSGSDMVVTNGNFLSTTITFPGTYTPLESAVYEHP